MSDYGDRLLSDDQIAAMSPAQRKDLIQRLERPLDEVFPPAVARRMRRNRLTLMVVGAVGLIPWMIYLAFTLLLMPVAVLSGAAIFCTCGSNRVTVPAVMSK